MKLDEWELISVIAGRFGLDGGAMFGVVPRVMWERLLAPDEFNRIPMVMRLLVARGHGRTGGARIVLQCSPDDSVDTTSHLLRCSPGKRQQQNAFRLNTLKDQVRDAVRQCHSLAGPGTRDNQQRASPKWLISG